MAAAWRRVKAIKGSAGVDGRTVQDTAVYLKTVWPDMRARCSRSSTSESSVTIRGVRTQL